MRPLAGTARGVAASPAPVKAARAVEAARRDYLSVATAGKVLIALALGGFLTTAVFGFAAAMKVVVLGGLVAAATIFSQPAVGLLGIGLLCTLEPPMRPFVFDEFGLRYNTFNYFLAGAGLLFVRQIWSLHDVQTKLLAAFALVLAVQLILTPNLAAGLIGLLQVLVAFAIGGCFLRGLLSRHVLYWMALVNGTASAACVLAYLTFPPPVVALNENALGQVVVGGLASIALAVSVAGTVRSWPLIAVLATANCVVVFLTGSRSSFLVSALLGLYIVLRFPSVTSRSYLLVCALALFGWGTTAMTNQYDVTLEKWYRLVDPNLDMSQASSSRVDIAAVGWRLFLENPMGSGTGSFSEMDDNIAPVWQSGVLELRTTGRAAHSAWVKTLVENGVPGALLLFVYVLSFSWTRNRADRGVSRALGPLVTMVLATGFMFTEFQGKGLWLLAAGATVLLHRTAPLSSVENAPSSGRRDGYRASVLRPERRQVE